MPNPFSIFYYKPLSMLLEKLSRLVFICTMLVYCLGNIQLPFSNSYLAGNELLNLYLAIASVLLIALARTIDKWTGFELIFAGFVLYAIVKSFLGNEPYGLFPFSYLLAFLFYKGMKCYIQVQSASFLSKQLLILNCIILGFYIVVGIILEFDAGFEKSNLFFPDKSIYSIVIAMHLAFLAPLFFWYRRRYTTGLFLNLGFLLLAGGGLVLLGYTNGRAGWLGLFLAMGYVLFVLFPQREFRKRLLLCFVPLFGLLFSGLLFYKPGSSAGRLLIYKVSTALLKDEWLAGIGNGQFLVQYNLEQAKYFSRHNINGNEALLADNTYYAFNDFFQFLIENGVVGGIAALFFIAFLLAKVRRLNQGSENRHLVFASTASLICVITGAWFSYPLQMLPIFLHTAFCLSILSSPDSKPNISITSERWMKISRAGLLVIACILTGYYFQVFMYMNDSRKALLLARSGLRKEAFSTYHKLKKSYIKDAATYYSYAQQLYSAARLEEANEVVSKAKTMFSMNSLYLLTAKIEKELGNTEKAEYNYKIAVYMVPNRMLPRYELMNFYLGKGDTINALLWARSIADMPVKIRSTETDKMKAGATAKLQKLIRAH